DVPALYFCREPGEAMREPWLLGRYVRRATSPIELRRWGSGVAGFLNRFGSPLVDPRRVGDLVSAHYPRGQVGTLYLDDVPQSFLRVNHYGQWKGQLCLDDRMHSLSMLCMVLHSFTS
ncbi:unnamed protein product, partial [Prorocentrum cordatum]